MISITITCFFITFCSIYWSSFADDVCSGQRAGQCGERFHSQRTPQLRSGGGMVFRLRNSSSANASPLHQRGHAFRPSDHLLDGESLLESRSDSSSSSRPMAVTNTNRYRERGRRRHRQQTSTTTTSTTTTTTTTASPEDYYEYDDYYDDEYVDDYHLTTSTTTTTTTLAPKRRRGRRRFRRPPQTTPPTTTTTTTTLSPNYKPRADGRVIDYSADPNFPYELKSADLTEYPFFVSIPESKFDCTGRHDGYYADIALRCQVYHHCASGHQRYDFLCPNFTLFDQTTFTCRFVNTVDCLSSETHYKRNDELYVESTTAAPPVGQNLTQFSRN